MGKHDTHKRTTQGRTTTLERRAARAVKYGTAYRTISARSGR